MGQFWLSGASGARGREPGAVKCVATAMRKGAAGTLGYNSDIGLCSLRLGIFCKPLPCELTIRPRRQMPSSRSITSRLKPHLVLVTFNSRIEGSSGQGNLGTAATGDGRHRSVLAATPYRFNNGKDAMSTQARSPRRSEETTQVIEDDDVDQGSLRGGWRVGRAANEPVGIGERY
jgi:hypothetical protein